MSTLSLEVTIGRAASSSAPSVTNRALSGWNSWITSSNWLAIALSLLGPTLTSPVRIAISTSSLGSAFSANLSWWFNAPSMALVSDSSGSAIPNLSAAASADFLPITGPLMPALTPKSLSLSIVITRVLTM